MQWLERVDDRVTRVCMSVDRITASPDGSLLALFAFSPDGYDTKAREVVRVVARATGREVVAIEEPGVLHDLAWVDDHTLLIARDDGDDGSRLSSHAIPDGGVGAERRIEHGFRPLEIGVSADGRRALLRPMYVNDSRPQPHSAVVALPSLAPLLRVTPDSFGDSWVSDAHLSDDGAWALVVRDGMRLSVLSVDRPEDEPVTFIACDSAWIVPTWISPTRCVLVARDFAWRGPPTRFSLLDVEAWAITDLSWSQPYELADPGVKANPDRRKVAGVLQSWTESPQRAPRLTVLDVNDWTAVAEHENARIEAFCWTRDGGALLTAERVARGIRVERWSPDDGRRAVIAEVALDAPFYGPSLATAGDGAALLQWSRDEIDSEAALIDLAP